jgi:hypothetical protein
MPQGSHVYIPVIMNMLRQTLRPLTLALPAEACYNVPNCPIARCPNEQSAHFGVLQLGQYGGHKRRA